MFFRQVVIGLRDRDHRGELLDLDVRAAVEEAAEGREGRLHDAHAGLPRVAVGELGLADEIRADLGVLHRLLVDGVGLLEREVAGVAVGSLPVDRQVAGRAPDRLHEAVDRADRDELVAAVDHVDDRADLERLGEGGVVGRDAEHHELVAHGLGVLGEEVARRGDEDERVAAVFAVGDDADRVDGRRHLRGDDDLGGDAVGLLDQEGAGLGAALAEDLAELDGVVQQAVRRWRGCGRRTSGRPSPRASPGRACRR